MAKAKVEVLTEKPATFTKAQVLSATRYTEDKDILSVVLAEKAKYTLDEVDSLIQKFLKGKVK